VKRWLFALALCLAGFPALAENISVTPGGGGGAATSITVGTTTISGGTSGNIEFNNAGVLGEKAVTGTGSVVLATSPTLITPNIGTPSAGVATNLTGTAAGLTAGNVTTNANLTGPITSVGNATSIASQTGTGTKFVVDTSPALAGTPTTPTAAAGTNTTQIASTAYVTTAVANAIAGVNPAVAVQAATTAASDTSGLTYNNGVAGIGATFTGSVNTAFTVDGFTFTTLNQRVLIKNDTQSPSGAFNGIYYVTQLQTGILPPILTRALDYDAPSDINNTGAIPVVNGTANGTTSWLLTSAVNTVGTDPLTFTKFSVNPITTPQTLGQSHIPFVLVSSGSYGNNGALTGITAVATAYPNAYCWAPTNSISAATPAGWYYCTFQSTTAATVFNNTYTSGTPTIPGSPTAFVTTGPGAYTQTTGSNIAAYTLAIAGNTIGVNGSVAITSSQTLNNTAGLKTTTFNYGSYAFASRAIATNLSGGMVGGFSNRGVANVQVPLTSGIAGAGNAGSTGLTFGAIDSTSSQNLVANLQLATPTDTMALENIVVQLIPGVP
jgi:hypothetical protein